MSTPEQPARWREQNQAMWDERVDIHLASDFYDLPAIRAGKNPLRSFELPEVGDVTGKSLVHLQCHLGTDTLGWARLGAEVVGLDFSPTAIAAAQKLAGELGHPGARFVVSDVYAAADALNGRTFDIVYTGIGALCWLPDLREWARVVASLLRPGGFLYLTEFHPIVMCLGDGGSTIVNDYFNREPSIVDEPGTYADPTAATQNNVSVEWHHPLGDVLSSIAAAGLRLEFLHEHDVTLFENVEGMVKGDDGFRLAPDRPRVPLMYSLRALKQ